MYTGRAMSAEGKVVSAFIKIFSVIALVCLLSNSALGQGREEFGDKQAEPQMMNQAPNAIPTLRLEKPKYVLGESIRFWIGVECTDDNIIHEKYWNTCFLHITRPDGTVTKQSVSWPVDGMLYHGWTGGWGFGKEEVQTGKYTLVFEFAKKKTKPVELRVEELDIMNQVIAKFDFRRSGEISKDVRIPVILTVQNNSKYVIQFPKRGVDGANISLRVIRDEPPRHASFFYPVEKLRSSFKEGIPRISYDIYDWRIAPRVPSVVLKPGEHFEQELSLEDAYEFWGSGQYKVTFSTTIDILVGKENGKFAAFCPIRLPVVGTEHFNIQEIKQN